MPLSLEASKKNMQQKPRAEQSASTPIFIRKESTHVSPGIKRPPIEATAKGRSISDIRHDTSRAPVSRQKAKQTYRGNRKERMERLSIGISAVILAVAAGVVLGWFVFVQLLITAPHILSALPATTTLALFVEDPGAAATIVNRLPKETRDDAQQWLTRYGVSQEWTQQVLQAPLAVGWIEGKAVPFVVVQETEEVQRGLETLQKTQHIQTVALPEDGGTAWSLSAQDDDTHLYIAEQGTVLLAATDPGTLSLLVRTVRRTVPALSQNEAVTNVLRKLPRKKTLTFVAKPPFVFPGSDALPTLLQPSTTLPATTTIIGGTVRLEASNIQVEMFLPTTEVTTKTTAPTDLTAFLPTETVVALSVSDISQAVTDMTQTTQPKDVAITPQREILVDAVNQAMELDLQKDLLPKLVGPTLLLVTKTGEARSYALVAKTNAQMDDAFLKAREQAILDRAAREHPTEREFTLDDGTKARELIPDTEAFSFVSADEGKTPIRSLQGTGIEGGISYTRLGDVLIFGTDRAVVQGIIQAKQGDQRFTLPQALRNAKGGAFFYANLEDQMNGLLRDVLLEEEPARDGVYLHGLIRQ